MKKFLSVLLTLALLFGLAVPTTTAQAAEETEILVNNWDLVWAENNFDGYQEKEKRMYNGAGCYGFKPTNFEYPATVDFTVDADVAGVYKIVIVYAAQTSDGYTRSVDLFVNDENQGQLDFATVDAIYKDYGWEVTDEHTVYVSLTAGENEISFRTPANYNDGAWVAIHGGTGKAKTPNIYGIRYSLRAASAEPTVAPTEAPTATPEPTVAPTVAPTATPEPTVAPTAAPTEAPKPTVAPTTAPTVAPTEAPKQSQKEIVEALYALKDGETLEGKHTLTGVIDSFKYTYNPEYSTIQLTIIVDGLKDMPVVCYKLGGEGIDKVEVGDTITVNGQLKNYKGTYEFNGCTLVSYKKPVVGGEYVIQKGDTLSKIAKAAGVTLKELIAANDIENPDLIHKGDKIIIPTITVERHIVVKGDTLSKIAKANGCKVSDLVKLNALTNPDLIHVGDIIVLP